MTRKGHFLNPEVLIKRNTPFLLVYSGAASLLDKSKLPLDLLQQHSSTPGYRSSEEEDEESDEDLLPKRSKRSADGYYAYSNNEVEDFKQRKAHVDAFRKNGPKVLKTRKNQAGFANLT